MTSGCHQNEKTNKTRPELMRSDTISTDAGPVSGFSKRAWSTERRKHSSFVRTNSFKRSWWGRVERHQLSSSLDPKYNNVSNKTVLHKILDGKPILQQNLHSIFCSGHCTEVKLSVTLSRPAPIQNLQYAHTVLDTSRRGRCKHSGTLYPGVIQTEKS